MYTRKKPLMRLCLSVTMAGVFVLAAIVASQATVSAASPKGLKFSPHSIITQPKGVKPNTGVVPNATCDADATAAGCDTSAGFSGSLTGTLTAGVSDGTVTAPDPLNGSGSQTIGFSFPSTVIDTRGSGGWVLSAASAGLTVPVASNTGVTTASDAFNITTVVPTCASICTGAANVGSQLGPIPSSSSSINYASVTGALGDYGSTNIVTSGTVTLGAATIAGSYNGTITVTAAPAV